MRGFTLIEVLIYIALFSLLMGGLVTAVFAIQATAEKNDAQALLLEEGMFILETFSFAAKDGTIAEYRLAGTRLVRIVDRTDIPVSSNQVEMSDFQTITTELATGSATYLDIRFTLAAHAPDGTLLQHEFSEQSYLTTL